MRTAARSSTNGSPPPASSPPPPVCCPRSPPAPLAWFTPRVPSRALIAAFLCVAVAEAGFLVKNYTHADHNITRLLASTRGLGARSTLVPLLGAYDARPGSALVPMMKAINYAAIDHELVNLDNYEAGTDYFPITFAP